MKKLSFILVSLLLIFKVSFANTYGTDPQTFVAELVNDAIAKLSSKDINKADKKVFIEQLAKENVDINALGLYTLGELRKTADKKSINNFQQEFQKYFLKSLTSRLTDYSSNIFEVTSAEKKNSSYTIVKSRVFGDNDQPEIKIDWRIYTKNPEKPLIRDLIVEGLSLARTQKEEFGSILNSNNNDINILISKLKEFTKS